jgi:hypothetical protein
MTAKKKHESHQHAPPPAPLWQSPVVIVSALVILFVLVGSWYGCTAKAADVRVNCHRAAVRVQTDDGNGTGSGGSGVIVKLHRRPLARKLAAPVLTAAHVVKDARRVWIWHRGRALPAKVLKIDKYWDLGLLEVEGLDPADGVELSGGVPAIGSRVQVCGFASGQLACRTGQVTAYGFPQGERRYADWMKISAGVRSGDSGGPIVGDDGRLAGVLWGGSDGTTGTQAQRLAWFISDVNMPQAAKPLGYRGQPIELASLPMPTYGEPIQQVALLPGQKKFQQKMLQGVGDINRNLSRPPSTFATGPIQPPAPTPIVISAPAPAACPAVDNGPVIQAIQEQGEATRAAIQALAEQKAEEAAPTGLKGKIHEKLEADAEEGGLKGKIAEKLLRWEERGSTGLWIAIAAGVVLLVYWHKNKHGPVAGVLEKMGKPELAEREQAIVERVEARVKGAVATAATANPIVGMAVSEADRVKAEIKDYIAARLAPAPGQPAAPPAQPPATPGT